MRILGIDPGLNITGYGLIEGSGLKINLIEAGFIRTTSKDNTSVRLERIYRSLNKLIDNVKPEVLVLEKLYSHWRHPTTAYVLGQARGIICLAAQQNHIPIVEYPATRIKKSVLGKGQASKLQIQRMIQNLFSLKALPKPPDIADALALAVGHSYMSLKKI